MVEAWTASMMASFDRNPAKPIVVSGMPTPVIASGGVASLDDLAALKAAGAPGIAGAISGRALYDGALDLADALKAQAGA